MSLGLLVVFAVIVIVVGVAVHRGWKHFSDGDGGILSKAFSYLRKLWHAIF